MMAFLMENCALLLPVLVAACALALAFILFIIWLLSQMR